MQPYPEINNQSGELPLDLVSAAGLELMVRDPDAYLQSQLRLISSIREHDAEKVRTTVGAKKSAEIVDELLERFKMVAESETEQRRRELEDLKFDRALLEDHWDAKDLDDRRKLGYPCLVVNKLDQPIQQVINELRQSRLAVQVKPRGRKSSKDGAEVRQGLYRAIEVESRADIARNWAAERAIKVGRGAYRVVKTYLNDGDFDMDLAIKRILNQGAVYFDPFATEPDWSDGEWCIITEDMPTRRFRRLYPDSQLASADVLTSETDYPAGWVTEDSIRIAEYFRVVHERRWLVQDPTTGEKKLLPKGTKPERIEGVKMRPVDKRTVEWFVCSAAEVLDTEVWEGRYIPVIPVIGKEYNIDGTERVFKGMISNSKDSQRMYNYFASLQTQAAKNTTIPTFTADPRSIENYKEHWKGMKVLPFHSNVGGEQMQRPEPVYDEPELQAVTLALREIDANIKSTTGRHSASLGEYGPDRSGRAIREMKEQGENSTVNYLENFAHVSLTYEAKVVLDMMRYVYDAPRLVRLLGDEDKERAVYINQPFYETKQGPVEAQMSETGEPLPLDPTQAGEGAQPWYSRAWDKVRGAVGIPGAQAMPPQWKKYDLTAEEDYSFVVTVGRSYKTQKEEDQAVYEAIVKAAPELAPIIAPFWIESLEGPAASRLAEVLRSMNPALGGGDEGDIPPQVQQQIAQMDQMIAQLTEALNQKIQEDELEAQKLAHQRETKLMELQSREKIAGLQIKADLIKAQAGIESETGIALLKTEADRLLQEMEQEHEERMAQLQAAHAAEADKRAAQREESKDGRAALLDTVKTFNAGKREADKDARKMIGEEKKDQRAAGRERDKDVRASFMNREADSRTAKREEEKDTRAADRDAAKDTRAFLKDLTLTPPDQRMTDGKSHKF